MLEARFDLLTHTDRGDAQTTALGKLGQSLEQLGNRLVGADGLSGNDDDAALDAVAEEGAMVGREEVVLVSPELEVGQRVGAVRSHQVAGESAQLRIRQIARCRKRSEDEVGDHGECRETK